MDKKLIKFSVLAATETFLPTIEKVLAPLLIQYPFWGFTWAAAIGLYSLYLYVEQDKLNEVIKFIQENPEKFAENIVSTDYFRSNFLKFLGEYLRQPNVQKRQALKRILLDNLSEEDKKYEIDRLNNVLSQISLDAIRNLVWIDKEILPIVGKDIEKEYSTFQKDDDTREHKRLKDITKARKNISSYVQTWIYENYNPNSEKLKKENGYTDEWNDKEKAKFNREHWIKEHEASKEKNSHWSEYVSLGIMTAIAEGGGEFGSSSGTVYKLTEFGENFIKYLEKEN